MDSLKKILIFFFILSQLMLFSVEKFKGYSSLNNQPEYTVAALFNPKFSEGGKWNENYFHEAQFSEQGITIFTNIVFASGFFDKKGCKLNCIITFKNGEKYVFNEDYGRDEYHVFDNKFCIQFGNNNFIELNGDTYLVQVKDKQINLNLHYKIINPPYIFGDGIVSIDKKNYLAFSLPIAGALVTGNLEYQGTTVNLKGRGSVGHDYNVLLPISNPRKWRSFWFYNDIYSINIDTVILLNKEEIDRIVICKNGQVYKSFLNTGLETQEYLYDKATCFSYPNKYRINYQDNQGDRIKAEIDFNSFTDKIQAFEHLSPMLHSIVASVVGEMWAYRFWSDAVFDLKINGKEEVIKIKGLGNYVDIE